MDARQAKGLEIAASRQITRKGNAWKVPSQTSGRKYAVDLNAQSCTCPDNKENGFKCKHIFAAEHAARQRESAEATPAPAEPAKRPTYKQEWPAYNQAQTQEKARFQELLYELCQGVEEPVQTMGRPRARFSDLIFASCLKVYGGLSGRRSQTDVREAGTRNYLSKPLRYNTVFKYLGLDALTPYLRELIRQSSLPLREVETCFAEDSSCFRVKGYVRWFNTKFGQEVANHDWIKLHIATGVRTNVIVAAEVSGRHDNDSKFFATLINQTAASGFTIREAYADKEYSSRAHLRLVKKHGGTAYIDFKTNAKGGSKCDVWNKMFHYYCLHREEFYEHYHLRSNAESSFWMLKSKFSEQICSKTKTAQRNELYCKVLCHNICCVIQSMYELGIEPDFIGKKIICPQSQDAAYNVE